MRKRLDRRIQRLARRQNNVVSRSELRDIGVSDWMIHYRLERLHWQQLHRGVYLLGAAAPTLDQQIVAARKAAGTRECMAADDCAAYLWDLDGVPTPKHVTLVVGPKSEPAPKGVTIHRTGRVTVRQFRRGIPVTTIEETLLSLAASDLTMNQLERAVESALLQKHTNEFQMWRFIAKNSRPGVRGIVRLRRVMTARPNGRPARSVLEIFAMRLVRRAGVPLPVRNYEIADVDGWQAELDLVWIELMKAIEVDGKAFHSTATQTRRDRKRQLRAEALGWSFLRLTWDDVVNHPEATIARIRGLLFGVVAA